MLVILGITRCRVKKEIKRNQEMDQATVDIDATRFILTREARFQYLTKTKK